MTVETDACTMTDTLKREQIAMALYDHEPKYRHRHEGTEQRCRWEDLYAQEKVIYFDRADAVLAALTPPDTANRAVLDCPVDSDAFDYATTIGEVFETMLVNLIDDPEGFSGKRPFGYSGWMWSLYGALVRGGLVYGTFDDDGYLDECDRRHAIHLLNSAIVHAFSRRYSDV